jgi:hypothetical protein
MMDAPPLQLMGSFWEDLETLWIQLEANIGRAKDLQKRTERMQMLMLTKRNWTEPRQRVEGTLEDLLSNLNAEQSPNALSWVARIRSRWEEIKTTQEAQGAELPT